QWNVGGEQHQARCQLVAFEIEHRTQPVATGAIANLIVVLSEDDKLLGRPACRRCAEAPAAEMGVLASKGKDVARGADELVERAGIGIVPVPLASEIRVQGVVKIVGPLCRQAITAEALWPDNAHIIQVALAD